MKEAEKVKRTITIGLIIILALLSFSCRKKESGKQSNPSGEIEEEKVSVTSVLDSSSGSAGELPAPSVSSAKESDDFTLSEFYRGGEILIRAEFGTSSGLLSFNTDDDEIREIIRYLASSSPDIVDGVTYTLSDGELCIFYSPKSEDEVENEWKSFKSLLNTYNSEKAEREESSSSSSLVMTKSSDTVKGTLTVAVYSEKAEITVSGEFSSSELDSFISFIRSDYPSLVSCGTLSVEYPVVTLIYSPDFTDSECRELFDVITALVDEYFKDEESSPQTEIPPQNTLLESAALAENDGEKDPVELPRECEKERRFSISAVLQNSLDRGYERPYVLSSYLKIDYAITSSFSLGVLSGYDWSGFVPLAFSVRYYTRMLPDLYLEGTFGGRIGVAANMNYGEYFTLTSLGYELPLDGRWSLFTSADLLYRWGKRGDALRFSLSFGGRVRF